METRTITVLSNPAQRGFESPQEMDPDMTEQRKAPDPPDDLFHRLRQVSSPRARQQTPQAQALDAFTAAAIEYGKPITTREEMILRRRWTSLRRQGCSQEDILNSIRWWQWDVDLTGVRSLFRSYFAYVRDHLQLTDPGPEASSSREAAGRLRRIEGAGPR